MFIHIGRNTRFTTRFRLFGGPLSELCFGQNQIRLQVTQYNGLSFPQMVERLTLSRYRDRCIRFETPADSTPAIATIPIRCRIVIRQEAALPDRPGECQDCASRRGRQDSQAPPFQKRVFKPGLPRGAGRSPLSPNRSGNGGVPSSSNRR